MSFNSIFTTNGTTTSCSEIPNSNKTVIITSLYEGIPQTLILNVVVWIILILLFTLLRQQAWDFHRLGLVNSLTGKRWTQIFYAHGNNQEILNSFNSNEMSSNNDPHFDMDAGESHSIRIARQASVKDTGFFSWITATWKLRTDQILKHSGPDAVHYLSFQQHLIVVMGIISFVSIVIILPINFQGTLSGDINSFSHTTIANLDGDSYLLWVHTIFAILFVPLVVLIMRRSSGRNAFKVAPTKTIMAIGIAKPDCNRQIIQNYLQQIFPDVEIQDIQLAYNVRKLTDIAQEYEQVIEARIYCEQHRGSIKVRPNCLACHTVEALEFYKVEEQRLCGEVARLRAAALNDALGISFITVSSTGAAKHIIKHFKPSCVKDWKLSYSPLPSDIFWENLTTNTAKWYLRWIIVNALLFMFLFAFTTPAYLVTVIRSVTNSTKINEITESSPLVTEFLPTLLLWSLTALMPVVVAFSETWLNHFTRSDYNYVVMTKTFGYLLFMILILPSLGLATASTFLEWSFTGANANETFRFGCVFLPDRGAFFVNYVITMTFIGTALELMRFPDLILYIYRLLMARSEAETPYIRKNIIIEFPFGIHYSWQLLVFTMGVFYSVACPLITPFALLYLVMKNFNDKHNLYFAYGPSHMISQGGGKIHSTAVTMTKFSVILLLIVLTGLSYFRNGNQWNLRTMVTGMSLLISLTLFAFMSPIKKCTTKPLPIIEDYTMPQPVYIADVFLNNRVMGNSPSHLSYGSSDITESLTHSSPQRI